MSREAEIPVDTAAITSFTAILSQSKVKGRHHRMKINGLLIYKIQTSIVKLYEYRSDLISAAVTGRIDVKGEISQ